MDTGYSYVIAQHLAPQHESLMFQLLERHAPITVHEAKHIDALQPNTVYVTPPNKDVQFVGGRIKLSPPLLQTGPKPSVDLFFQSIAENCGEGCFGIILSGTGSDGVRGVQAIKAAGGYLLAQDAATAKYSGMPEAAQRTGFEDLIGAPRQLAKEVSTLGERRNQLSGQRENVTEESAVDRILNAVRIATGVDFLAYKRGTIVRQIESRMVATISETLSIYADLVEKDRNECERLRKRVLICVTSFFRDTEAYEALRAEVAKIVELRPALTALRVWVAGCATGEEAHSLAMMLLDVAPGIRFQIFATDLDDDSISYARAGVYPEVAIHGVSTEMRARYFQDVGNGFRIKRYVCESIVFARHNLIDDPPFLNMDIVTCRNVLIYFQPKLQSHLFRQFNQSLRDRGLLLIGKSESITASEVAFFMENDRSQRLYQSRTQPVIMNDQTRSAIANRSWMSRPIDVPPVSVPDRRNDGLLPDLLFAKLLLPSVLIDEGQRIIESFGDTARSLSVGADRPNFSITSLVPEKIRIQLRAEVFRARRENTIQLSSPTEIEIGGEIVRIKVRVKPITLETDTEVFLLSFIELPLLPSRLEGGDNDDEGSHSDSQFQALEDDLRTTREHLQTVVEEFETSNEELQSLNEELQSSNEEMQASN